MKFASPAWLWLLLGLPLLYYWALSDEKRRERQLATFVAKSLWQQIIPDLDPLARQKKLTRWLLALGFVLLALARPQWGTHEETAHVTGLDVMFVLDVSSSMDVEDVAPSRMKKARHVIKSIIERMSGDRIGAVAFAASSYLACPLTTDVSYVTDITANLGPHSVTNQGTDIGLGLETAQKALERGAEEGGAAKPGGVISEVMILISDGEDQEAQALQVAAKLKTAGIKLFVLGVGTEKGGPIPVRDESGNLHGYKKERKGDPIVSTFRPDALMKIASEAGGRYWNVTANETEIDELLHDVSGLNRGEFAERRYVVYEDRFQFPLAIALALFFLELSLPVRKLTSVAGLFFFVGLMGGLTGCESLSSYQENEKGIDAFKGGKADDAKQHFANAQARDPGNPALKFNLGDVQSQGSEADGAIANFSEAAKDALEKGNPGLAGRALFNLGVVASKKGDMAAALNGYLGAIDAAKKAKDVELEKDARKNIELLVEQQQKQEQEKKEKEKQEKEQEQEKKDQDKKDQESKQDQQDKKDQKDQKDKGKDQDQGKDKDKESKDAKDKKPQDQSQQPKNNEDESQKRQKFRSLKLSDEDADRVMAELKNREQQLQQKIRKQNVKPQNNQKDW